MKTKKVFTMIFCAMVFSALVTGCGKDSNINNVTDTENSSIEITKPDVMSLTAIDLIEDVNIKGIIDYNNITGLTDKEVVNQINSYLENYTTYKRINEGIVSEESIINIDYVGKIDGIEFEGGSGENALLDIDNNDFIDGFAKQCIGKNVGEEFDINVTFPEDYDGTYIDLESKEKKLAGVNAVFSIKINYLAGDKYTSYNEMDDQAASDLTGGYHKTLQELYDGTKEELIEIKLNELEVSMWDDLVANIKYKDGQEEIIQKLINEEYNYELAYYKQMSEYYQVEFEDFIVDNLGFENQDAYLEHMTKNAEYIVKQNILVDYISEKYNLVITDKDYEVLALELAGEYGYETISEFEKDYEKIEIYEFLQYDKVTQFIQSENGYEKK